MKSPIGLVILMYMSLILVGCNGSQLSRQADCVHGAKLLVKVLGDNDNKLTGEVNPEAVANEINLRCSIYSRGLEEKD